MCYGPRPSRCNKMYLLPPKYSGTVCCLNYELCVCVSERERERERGRDPDEVKERASERERERGRRERERKIERDGVNCPLHYSTEKVWVCERERGKDTLREIKKEGGIETERMS